MRKGGSLHIHDRHLTAPYCQTISFELYYNRKERYSKSNRDYAKTQIDALPDNAVEKVIEFISFQRFSLGLFDDDDDDDYLASIPGMTESIKEGLATPLSECVPLSKVWPDV